MVYRQVERMTPQCQGGSRTKHVSNHGEMYKTCSLYTFCAYIANRTGYAAPRAALKPQFWAQQNKSSTPLGITLAIPVYKTLLCFVTSMGYLCTKVSFQILCSH